MTTTSREQTTKRVEKGITRYDGPTSGLMVRATRDGKTKNKFFSDKTYGGKRKALVAARRYYELLIKRLPEPKTTEGLMNARNVSGIVGVHKAETRTNGNVYESWTATWKKDGKREKKSFSIDKYGVRKSKQLAIIARELKSTDTDRVIRLYNRRRKNK